MSRTQAHLMKVSLLLRKQAAEDMPHGYVQEPADAECRYDTQG